MEKEFHYTPEGVCSREMIITYEDGIIKGFKVIGGCNGNLQGISALLIGMKLDDAAEKLKGIKCGHRSTSCPDQISHAIKALEALQND